MTIKEKALAHYDRMIAWAEKQDPEAPAINTDMFDALGEFLSVDDCAYCQAYYCSECPLDVAGYGHCCAGAAGDAIAAETWGEWLKAAKRVRAYIKKKG